MPNGEGEGVFSLPGDFSVKHALQRRRQLELRMSGQTGLSPSKSCLMGDADAAKPKGGVCGWCSCHRGKDRGCLRSKVEFIFAHLKGALIQGGSLAGGLSVSLGSLSVVSSTRHCMRIYVYIYIYIYIW